MSTGATEDATVDLAGEVARLERRLEALARVQRQWRAGFVALLLVASPLLLGQSRGAQHYRGASFILVDPWSGRECAVFGLSRHGEPVLEMRDRNGVLRLDLEVAKDGAPSLWMMDPSGEVRGSFGLTEGGTPGLRMWDTSGEVRGGFGLSAFGSPGLWMRDASGELRGSFGLAQDGSPSVELNDRSGRRQWRAPQD